MIYYAPSVLNRRDALRLLAGTALALAANRLAPAQTASTLARIPSPTDAGSRSYSSLTPELTEGPFYIDLERVRRDITEGRSGVPLRLRIQVAHLTTGEPVAGAAVDVWHCDAQGVYSGFNRLTPPPAKDGPSFASGHPPSMMATHGAVPPPSPGGWPPGGPGGHGFGPGYYRQPDNQLTFLRGVQLTDSAGLAQFDTIFPGWYRGRATHIHVRVHTGGLVSDGRYRQGHISHTGQVFFPEETTNRIYQLSAYARKEDGRIPLHSDFIFRPGGADIARLSCMDPQKPQAGYFSNTLLVIDPSAVPKRA